MNIAPNNLALHVFGINQTIRFPGFYAAQKNSLQVQTEVAKNQYQMNERLIRKEVTIAYQTILFWKKMIANYSQLDSIYSNFSSAATQKFNAGESNNLEMLTAKTKQQEVSMLLSTGQANYEKAIQELNKWLQTDEKYTVDNDIFKSIDLNKLDTNSHPGLVYFANSKLLAERNLQLNKQNARPDITLGVFQGTNNGATPNRYLGISAGLAIPIFYGADKAKINASKTEMEMRNNQYEDYSLQLTSKYNSLVSDAYTYSLGIDYYNDFGKSLAEETILNADKAYKAGEIDYLQYSQLLENAAKIKTNYLQNVYFYNLVVTEANYILN